MTAVKTWKLSRDTAILAQILNFLPGLEQTKVMAKALDGSVYIQTIGLPIKYANISILASRDEIAAVSQAEADGALVSCVYRGVRYLGYIEGAIEWEAIQTGYWYHTNFRLLIEEEVSV